MKNTDPSRKPPSTATLRRKPTVKMDPTIWSNLPDELLELILSCLPLKTFFNLRSTCKRFNRMILSPSFASKHSSSSETTPFSAFLLLSHPQLHGRFALYDSDLATWRDLTVSSLSLSHSPSTLVSSSNGLLCFSLPHSASFLVCNVLARSSRAVKFPSRPFAFESVSLVPAATGYAILVISSSNQTLLYTSKTRSWTRPDTFDPTLNLNDRGVFHDGRLYYTTHEPFSVASFDAEKAEWARPRSELPSDVTFARLVAGDGRLFLVGGVGRNGISRSLKVWRLEEEGTRWAETESVPEMMCQKLMSVCYHNYQHVYCFWHQGTICVGCYNWPEILYYRFSRRTWHWLPKCPSVPHKWSCGFRWSSFVPQLYASV